jgi:Pyridoxamine 5'-phosphate oxidase
MWARRVTCAHTAGSPATRRRSDAVFVHLSTLRRSGAPRNWVVWAGREDDRILICTDEPNRKAKDMRRDPRVGLSFLDPANP